MSLRTQLSDVQGQMIQVSDEMEAIGQAAADEGRDLNDTDRELLAACENRFTGLDASCQTLSKAITVADRMAAAKITPAHVAESGTSEPATSLTTLPAKARHQKSKVFESNFEAYAAGMFMAGVCGNQHARQWCKERNVAFRPRGAMEEGTDSAGGYSVPDPMAATIIRLVESFGVFRQYSRNMPMTSDTLDVPRYLDGLTVYYPAEGAAITASDITFGTVRLTAVKYAQIAIYSTELSEDSVISMADLVTTDMAYKFAVAEDTNSFLGDGTATYGGITGVGPALIAAGGSTVTSAGATVGTLALGDFEEQSALLPDYAGINPRWYMNRAVYYGAVVPLLNALGGTDIRQAEAGGEMLLFGWPVTFTQVLPGAAAGVDDLVSVFGDLSMGSFLGTNRNVGIRMLNELYAANDQIGVVGTLRSDTQIFSAGDGTNAGAITGLFLAAA